MGVGNADFLQEAQPFRVAALVRDRMRVLCGEVPAEGENWSNICRFFEITEAEEALPELADIVRKKRIAALKEIARDLEAFYLSKQSNVPDTGQLVLCVLEGWWLRETIVPVFGKKTVYIDSTFAIVHERCLEEQPA